MRRAFIASRGGSGRVRVVPVAVVVLAVTVAAQTVIKLPKNNFTPQQDVQIGREAAAEVRKQYPIIRDEQIASYLARIGDRLVAAAPPELKQSVYEYSFTPVNLKEINAFALPGGPMFVQRGMFEAAASEAEVAGVMAHELSHVLLRHGTANATKAQNPWLQIGQLAGAVGGAMVGGQTGALIAQGSEFGLGTILLKYSREFEKQADLLGVQIMARAGYDPRALGHMFDTIERAAKSSGGSGPQWLNSHPNPGNRVEYIDKEAASLTVATAADTSGFPAIKSVVAALPPAKGPGDLAKPAPASGAAAESAGIPGEAIPAPSSQYREVSGGKIFRASVPSNWTPLASKSSIKVVPRNGYGELNGKTVFTCGVEFGVMKAETRDLAEATNAWLNAVAQNNPDVRLAGTQQMTRLSGRSALATPLVGPSPLGGKERITIYTTLLADSATVFYYLTVVQEKDADAYKDTFRHIGESIRLTEVR
jgi:beta-barrel assembly-enhancing protease